MKVELIPGGVTSPRGYRAAAVMAGIKAARNDVALICAAAPAAVAGVFTTNRIKAAPVKLCQGRVKSGRAQAIIVNSGNANACTGPQGIEDARTTAQLTAQALGMAEDLVLVCSTGTIGVPLPMDKVRPAIPRAAAALSDTGGDAAAKAIMTTDTVDKQIAARLKVDGRIVTIGGMAKGAGMIEPNMATLLVFLTTDAAVAPESLQRALKAAADGSFNRISVDGDQSTNDTALLLANGAAGHAPLNEKHPDWLAFCEALNEVTRALALKIVGDGEGATKLVTVAVRGAASDEDARKAARAVSNSLLVKTSWFGEDPNWGRVIDAVGYSGAEVTEERVDIRYDDVPAIRGGRVSGASSFDQLKQVISKKAFTITIDLNLGAGSHTMYTCDCSYEYVKINGSYMT